MGPAGRVLDQALEEVGTARASADRQEAMAAFVADLLVVAKAVTTA